MTKFLRKSDRRLPGTGDGNAQRFDVAPQHAHAERVKGRDHGLGDGESANQLVHALDHLAGGLVGEGDGEDGLRHHAQVLDQMGDAVGDDARLAAARAGQDQHRAVGGFDGFALLRD